MQKIYQFGFFLDGGSAIWEKIEWTRFVLSRAKKNERLPHYNVPYSENSCHWIFLMFEES